MGYPHPSHPRETPVLSRYFGDAEARTLAGWRARGGYEALQKALAMDPQDIQNVVKDSGLRGRGGAGFPTGMKWSFMKPDGKTHYLCCNADESEPGTFKDREIMRWTPHGLVEGVALGAHAIYAETAYIYIRGEFTEPYARVCAAVEEAYAAGILGANAMGSGKRVDVHVHRGAGAYICGEETALMNSLEGRRGNPRIKPPFPAVAGLFGKPTTINNVETLTTVPYIIKNGAEWYKQFGRPDNPKSIGTKLFSVCGNITRPGNYEVALGFPFKEFLYDLCGGPLPGREIKAVIPGGSSVPILTREEAEAAIMDYEGMVAAGTMLGSGGAIVFDDRQCMVRQIARLTRFYAHESCAQCSQCREGTAWITRIMERIRDGEGTMEDLDTLLSIADNMSGKTICVLSDSCATPVISGLKKFRHEFEAKIAANPSKVTVPAALRASAA
ncbi:MAG: NADH-quinone oxidoreductase subunit F [Gemmatimonas sp.]|uniref:NADH-quinone oxidoreductase subunit NuoF n=1 Tax=Gemmatimonas sp. UBA7669 TaxID=1946568 RepID=UPI0025BF4896|nr:NADH-quinone oxidoreductase subunit NuoF [Gemmatimonas sp. UBA7669]MBA3918224.1 NADH-quinone oxidoreductase subunit F [Gemmatimonas sp.]